MPRTATKIEEKTSKSEDKYIYVRIHRHKKNDYPHIKNFIVYGMKFSEVGGWHRVKSTITFAGKLIDLKSYLEELHHDNEDHESPQLFDVVNKAEAEKIEKREREAEARKQRGRQVSESIDMTGSERGDLSSDEVRGKLNRRKFERSTRSANKDEL